MSINRVAHIISIVGIAFTAQLQAESIIFAGNQGVVHSFETTTGEVQFRGICGGPVSSMVVKDQTLFLGDRSGTMYTFDTSTNLVQGAFSLETDANGMSLVGGEVVVADSDGAVLFVDPNTFEIMDTLQVSGTDITAIGFDAGGMFVGGESTIALRTHIGQNNFQFFAACGSMIQSMAFGPETMYLGGIALGGSTTGTIYKFNKFEGGVEYVGTHDIESDVNAMVYSDGFLFVAGSDGIIHQMDPITGDIVREINTGIDIQAMTKEHGVESCPADFDISGRLNFLDVSRFIQLFTDQLTPGDMNGDGEFNFFDVSEFISLYSGGC